MSHIYSVPPVADANRVLVKLRPTAAIGSAESRAELRPLHDTPADSDAGVGGEPQWFVADLPDGAATPWDLAHGRVAEQLGVTAADVLFVEPDIVHGLVLEPWAESQMHGAFAVGADCNRQIAQDPSNRKPVVADRFAWHLDEEYTQLGRARDAVQFSEPRTRIAHLDTGYYGKHVTTPARLQRHLERNFVPDGGALAGAGDPRNPVFLLDTSGHGTGTLGVLAGGPAPEYGALPLGGAPEAEVVPLRIAERPEYLRSSAFAQALRYAVSVGCDVVSMNLGGFPVQSWREEVDRAYRAGVTIVSAAGNNRRHLPTRFLVYPARYGRVVAACGVMADGQPYHNLSGFQVEGNAGPNSVMSSALGAYTPNIPWPVGGCESLVRLDGAGTEAAASQIAAAAALWLERFKGDLPRDWRRVEAVRHALFSTARRLHHARLGHGILQAADALGVPPYRHLPLTPPEPRGLPVFRAIAGLDLTEPPPRELMFNLELAQRWLVNPEFQRIVPDPDATDPLSGRPLRELMEAILEDAGASLALRRHVATRLKVVAGRAAAYPASTAAVLPEVVPACEPPPPVKRPMHRRLRVYASDPSLSGRLDTVEMNEVTLAVSWEELAGGELAGEYLVFEDIDASGERYSAADLNDPHLLAQDGWAPAEGNPHFHQQMVYAVVMKTIAHFERALGRPVFWRALPAPEDPEGAELYTPRLTVRPHALMEANAYYSPEEVALLFGYFDAGADDPGELVPGSRVYTCLSHDIIVHEATHAILDGLYRRFNEPTNPDVLALHEAFADTVALLQHFTMPEVLANEIRRTRGDIEAESVLGSLAVQFGRAAGKRGALRNAIGRLEDGVWKRLAPDPAELRRRLAPHARGAVLVAAVFDAFIAIYKTRVADLLRLSTGGTGVLPEGAIHPDLVRRLSGEAAKTAGHVLTMCIRALDYLPPADVTFFEFLRALITADFDMVRDDRHNYRVAFVEAFRRRGLLAGQAKLGADRSASYLADALRWKGIDLTFYSDEPEYRTVIDELKRFADACFYVRERRRLFEVTHEHCAGLHRRLEAAFSAAPELAAALGIDPSQPFQVQELRRAMRISPDGGHVPQVIVVLEQSARIEADEEMGTPAYGFRGGSTLVVDLSVPEIKYAIVKNLNSSARREQTAAFVREVAGDPLRALVFAPDRREPFAALHTLADEGL